MAQTLRVRRDQFHTWRVGEFLDPLNPEVSSYLERAKAFFFQQTGDAHLAQQMAFQSLADLRAQQALSLAYFDVFFISAVLAVSLAFLVLLMKRSVAEKGAHIGAE
jgi:DHA2 family multidrug resistance protein